MHVYYKTYGSLLQIPGALHKGVSDKLASLSQGQPPDVTGKNCHYSLPQTYLYSSLTHKDTVGIYQSLSFQTTRFRIKKG